MPKRKNVANTASIKRQRFVSADNMSNPRKGRSFADCMVTKAKWSPRNPVGAHEIGASSHRHAYFLCDKGHEWITTVYNAAHDYECPVCRKESRDPQEVLKRILAQTHRTEDGCMEWHKAPVLHYRGKGWTVHRLTKFLASGEHTKKGQHTCHNCGNAACVNPDHIRIDTAIANMADKERHGTLLCGERHPCSKLTDDQRRQILESNERDKEVAKRFNVSRAHVHRIRAGKSGGVRIHDRKTVLDQRIKNREQWRQRKLAPITEAHMKAAAARVLKNTVPANQVPNDETISLDKKCLLWQGYKDTDGYGYVRVRYRNMPSHAVVARVYHNDCQPIPKGLVVRHLCAKQPSCCEPSHLCIGTSQENSADTTKSGHRPHQKLRPEEVVEIYTKRYEVTAIKRAQSYNVSVGTIRSIDYGKNWRWLTKGLD